MTELITIASLLFVVYLLVIIMLKRDLRIPYWVSVIALPALGYLALMFIKWLASPDFY